MSAGRPIFSRETSEVLAGLCFHGRIILKRISRRLCAVDVNCIKVARDEHTLGFYRKKRQFLDHLSEHWWLPNNAAPLLLCSLRRVFRNSVTTVTVFIIPKGAAGTCQPMVLNRQELCLHASMSERSACARSVLAWFAARNRIATWTCWWRSCSVLTWKVKCGNVK
jgi:hypothetical protein